MTDSLPTVSAPAPLVVGAESAAGDAPAVVAVVVVRNAGPTLPETLQSLAEQDYANLEVLVVDAADQPVTDQVAEALPDAFIQRLSGNPGFAAAANQVLDLVSGGSFFLFCSDRVALSPDCVSALIGELYRSNAGIVTPKYVQWSDPRRLVAIGMGSDRFGVQVDLVEPGDFDQEQYDGVSDVFVAPEGVQLVRADLFRTLDGFDPTMESVSEDLDLCWRAQVIGARVVAVPEAKVRLRPVEADISDTAIANRRRLLGRNRLRTLLVTSSRFSLVRVVPLALLLLVLESLYSLAAGRRRQAGDALSAIGWNLGRLREIRARRKKLHELRQVSDRGVHGLQVGGSARLSAFFRGQFSVSDRLVGLAGSVRDSFTGRDSTSVRDGAIVGGLVVALLAFGSRGLIADGVTPVGQFLDLPGSGRLLGEWFSSWRSSGTGNPGHAPTAFLVLGVLKALFFWADGLLDLLLAVGPLVIGAVGAWRLSQPLASPRAAALAALVYAGNPLVLSMFSAGRWDALVIWACAPWLLRSLLFIQAVAPFDEPTLERPLTQKLLRFGLLVAVGATFVPATILVACLLASALALGSLAVLKTEGIRSLAFAVPTAIAVPGALHGLWTVEVLRNFRWSWFVGPASPEATFDSLADLLRFAPGLEGGRFLAIALLFAAAVPLFIAHAVRFEVATRAWIVALVFIGLTWADRRGGVPVGLPTAELMLAPAAAGLSLAVAAGVRSLDLDLVGYRFGWRQVVSFAGVVAIGASAILLFQSSLGGRWDMPAQGYGRSTELLSDRSEGPARMLWIGAESVLPQDAALSPGGTTYAISSDGVADAIGRWAPSLSPLDAQVGARLDFASADETARLGRLLAPYGIDIIVVVPQLAPAPYEGPEHDPGGGIVPALARQLDLQRLPGTPNLIVYRNLGSRGPAVALEEPLPLEGDAITQLNTDLSTGTRVQLGEHLGSQWTLIDGLGASETVLSVAAGGWTATGPDGEEVAVAERLGGLATIESTGLSGPVTLSYPTPLLHRVVLGAQLLLLAVTALLASRRLKLGP